MQSEGKKGNSEKEKKEIQSKEKIERKATVKR